MLFIENNHLYLHTMQSIYPSSLRLVTFLLFCQPIATYAIHDMKGHELAVSRHEDEVTALVQLLYTLALWN